jgi:hypothetical protein
LILVDLARREAVWVRTDAEDLEENAATFRIRVPKNQKLDSTSVGVIRDLAFSGITSPSHGDMELSSVVHLYDGNQKSLLELEARLASGMTQPSVERARVAFREIL